LVLAAVTLGGCHYVLDFADDVADVDGSAGDSPPLFRPDANVERCNNGVRDGEETATDCGGDCEGCVTGQPCGSGSDCLSGACALGSCEDSPRNCASIATSGTVQIDVDGSLPAEAFPVYCDQSFAGGGWQLVSVVPQGGVIAPSTTPVPFLGSANCQDLTTPCAGHIHPSQVTAATEIAILDVTTGEWLLLTQFSGSDTSSLRYFSLELAITNSDVCTAPHVCTSATLDPNLAATTSGYAMAYAPPLLQWWRLGGWYVGAGPVAGSMTGNVFRTNYAWANALSTRATADGVSSIRDEGTQRVYARVPAIPP
jgi:hypothetical protein